MKSILKMCAFMFVVFSVAYLYVQKDMLSNSIEFGGRDESLY